MEFSLRFFLNNARRAYQRFPICRTYIDTSRARTSLRCRFCCRQTMSCCSSNIIVWTDRHTYKLPILVLQMISEHCTVASLCTKRHVLFLYRLLSMECFHTNIHLEPIPLWRCSRYHNKRERHPLPKQRTVIVKIKNVAVAVAVLKWTIRFTPRCPIKQLTNHQLSFCF